jgi:hypothetical protein
MPSQLANVCLIIPAAAAPLLALQLHLPTATLSAAAESVIVGPDGQLVMLDRDNHLWEARQDIKTGQWVSSPEPLAKLGPGRPLGYDFDQEGNLIVCDSLKVC